MTPFQEYAHARWIADFPQWAYLREDIDGVGEPFDVNKSDRLEIRYQIPSPANAENIMWVVFAPFDVIVKFAVPGSHEHYDPDFYGGPDFDGDRSEFWPQAYEDAISEYVRAVIEGRMYVLHYDNNSVLVSSVEEFLRLNQLESCQYESWSCPTKEFKVTELG